MRWVLALLIFLSACAAPNKLYPTLRIPSEYRLSVGWISRCTATLVSPRVVLTARHCHPLPAIHRFCNGVDPCSTVTRVHVPPTRTDDRWSGDIALLELAEPIPRPPIAISEAPLIMLAGEPLYAEGRMGRAYPLEFDHTDLDFIHTLPIGVERVCFGDSGGPLLASREDGTPVIVGVHSHIWGKRGMRCGTRAAHVRVDPYANWILERLF